MKYDIVCFSHLRWDFVFQRPQQLMTRLSVQHRIYFIEEPVLDAKDTYYFKVYKDEVAEVNVITPHFPPGLEAASLLDAQNTVVKLILDVYSISKYIIWHYSPMSYAFSHELRPIYRVYDCMDELSNFLFAPAELKQNEAALLSSADIVFTGGHSLYEAKKSLHASIFCFPSSIDKSHFGKARELRVSGQEEPADQRPIPSPRIGFFGVIDERLNIDMLLELARLRPAWQFILVGPVVKIDPASLPRAENIHYLGPKSYGDLPRYLAGWDIAMMPFALNASTKFISPTKTPEYLAGGVPVIAPSISDVVTPYFHLGLVSIADTAAEFVYAGEQILAHRMPPAWREKVNDFLGEMSWDQTVADMSRLIEEGIRHHTSSSTNNIASYV
jgi:glycosyltransferase involved in cell wall biosynthesis